MRLGLTHMGNVDVAVKAMASKLGIDLVRLWSWGQTL